MNDIDEQAAALESGRGFADLSIWRKMWVRGADAAPWLNDLLSAELSGLESGSARRSLLLSPTGRTRAEVTVMSTGDGLLLVQDPVQDSAIGDSLSPYVLSSDVVLEDATAELGLVAFPGSGLPGGISGHRSTPSVLGDGVDVVPPASAVEEIAAAARADGLIEAGPAAVETWRIRRGHLRVGVDLGEDALPHEAGLDRLIGYAKGCFLGQEAVAKVRNLGHPPFVLLAATAPASLSPGDPVRAGETDVGLVTSAVTDGSEDSAAIVRVRWAARDGDLRAADGTPLEVRGPAVLP